ncbi:glycosyltransferase family 2 protein [Thomasclavelia cocleata]|uniref:glycosyltransferase family 2 protein n=1 Tax=Thomasclavelia cocleata TaxID=69824 RepID=UPI0024332D48|nr:glycosyltransferase family 2 protein [Thomasclavelia cocleata]
MANISVVVPVYKVEKYIDRCITSILNQTYNDFELVLVDDGSPDNCGKICDEYAKKDTRIHVIHQENRGLSAARNAGIDWSFKNSNSQWITFIDSDDWIDTRFLEELYNAAVQLNVNISTCNHVRAEEQIEVLKKSFLYEKYSVEEFYVMQRVVATVAWGKLYKKDCFSEIRYPVGKLHEDEFTTYLVLFNFNQIAFINEPLYFYFINYEGIMKSQWNIKRLDVIEAFEAQLAFFKQNGYNKAYKKVINEYLYIISYSLNNMKQNKIKWIIKEKYRIKFIRKTLKLRKQVNITISNYPALYNEFFPKFMYLYWFSKAQIKKIKR